MKPIPLSIVPGVVSKKTKLVPGGLFCLAGFGADLVDGDARQVAAPRPPTRSSTA
jgi:hypothetical protein